MTATATVRRSSNRKSHRPGTRPSRQAVRSRRRRKALAFIVIGLVLALLGASLWGVYFSTALVTKRVNLVGTHNLTRTQVSLAAQVPLGVPLIRQDLDAIAERTTTIPAVESAAVTRDWPSTITVTVVERRPVLAVHQSSGYVVVDKYGIAYQTQPMLPPDLLLAEVNIRRCATAQRGGHRCRCAATQAARKGRSDHGQQSRQHRPGPEFRTDGDLGEFIGF